MPVDLRSDTVTQPCTQMRQAMAEAPVGDDVFDEDPSVHALQDHAAALTGQEAGLFIPSGTMGNQIALLTHCRPGDDVLVGAGAHSFLYEAGGGAALAGVQFSVIGEGGHFDADDVRAAIKTTDGAGHIPPTSVVSVENTHNRGGGKVMSPAVFAEIAEVAHAHGLMVHIDGARIFNAAAAAGVGVDAWGRHADTITFCLSKGLGAPVGSVLCGAKATIHRAHRYRKMLGGGMRQAGIIAAAGLYALEHNVADLGTDHRRAKRLATALAEMSSATIDVARVESNIVIFDVSGASPAEICAAVAEDVLVLPFGPTQIRAVLHRDIGDGDVSRAIAALGRVLG